MAWASLRDLKSAGPNQRRRTISFPDFGDAVQSSYSAHTAQAFGEVGYIIVTGVVAIEPFTALAYVHFDDGAFTERGGSAVLVGGNDSRNVTHTTLGVDAASSYLLKDFMLLIARGAFGWRSAFGDVTPTSNLAAAKKAS